MNELIRKRLRARRKELGLTYQALSDITGLNKSTLQRYETGAIKNISYESIAIFSRALMVHKDYFFME